jgi:hypothetical protein
MQPTMACSYRFSALSGYFVDNVMAASSCLGGKLTTRPNLGLIDRQYDQNQPPNDLPWTRFRRHVDHLNQQSAPGESYKVLYLVCHGLSVHNIFMEEVGIEAWKVTPTPFCSLFTFSIVFLSPFCSLLTPLLFSLGAN